MMIGAKIFEGFGSRRFWLASFFCLVAVGIMLLGWQFLGQNDGQTKEVERMIIRILPSAKVTYVPNVHSPGEITLNLFRINYEGIVGSADRVIVSPHSVRMENVRLQADWGIFYASALALNGIDWERGFIRDGLAENIVIVHNDRALRISAAMAKLLAWGYWVPTRIEMVDARLVDNSRTTGSVDIRASETIVSFDPSIAGGGNVFARWARSFSAVTASNIAGRINNQELTAEQAGVRLLGRNAINDITSVELSATGLDFGGAIAEWRERLFYRRISAEIAWLIYRGGDGAWQSHIKWQWPLGGNGELVVEAISADSIWPDIELLRWRRVWGVWHDNGLVRRIIERNRRGRTLSETAAELSEQLMASPLFDGAVSARLDLERWLVSPGTLRFEMTGDGSVRDLYRVFDLERPENSQLRLSFR